MKSFDDFWAEVAIPKMGSVIEEAADTAALTANNGYEVTASILTKLMASLLKEYHVWLVSEILPHYSQPSPDHLSSED